MAFPARPAVLAQFNHIMQAGNLGQTYLFVGPQGAGKEVTALEIARLANCPRDPICNGPTLCESCQKAVTFQHPDIRWLCPAPANVDANQVREILERKREDVFYQPSFTASARISIGHPDDPGPFTIRALLRFLRVHAFQGRYKIAVVSDGHRMTNEAANAFLKTLEEPSPASLIMLLTSNRTGLLPTILSRCQQIRFDPYPEAELVELLGSRRQLPREAAQGLARSADGNVRKALALLQPQALALHIWARKLLEWVHEGRAGSAFLSAEALHLGKIPQEALPPGNDAIDDARDLASKRERAIQLCEMLNLYYSEVLGCREQGAGWRPRLPADVEQVRGWPQRRQTPNLLRDIDQVEATKREIDRNLNIGLTMAVLFQGLIEHAKQDQEVGRARD
ncbi:MAG: DNA polymerase III subunit [bacterium]